MQQYSQAEIVVTRAISISPDNFGSPSSLKVVSTYSVFHLAPKIIYYRKYVTAILMWL